MTLARQELLTATMPSLTRGVLLVRRQTPRFNIQAAAVLPSNEVVLVGGVSRHGSCKEIKIGYFIKRKRPRVF